MQKLGEERSAIREIFEYGRKRKEEIGKDRVFDFSLGNPCVLPPSCVKGAILDSLESPLGVSVHSYTSANGSQECRNAIASYISSAFGFEADADSVFVTCGAAASLSITLNALYEEGGEIIVFAPFFPEYRVFSEFAGLKVKTVLPKDHNFSIDEDALKQAIDEHTAGVIINSPNNPTGKILNDAEIIKIANILKQKEAQLKRDIFIIADEPYRELVYTDTPVPYIPKYYENTVVCYSFSKSMSLPGERIGYIFVPKNASGSKKLYAAVCGAARALGYVCAPSLFQKVITECIGNFSDISAYKENRDILTKSLTDYGYSLTNSDGAFYIFIKSPEEDASAFCERAKSFEILLVPSDSFGIGGYARLSYCVDKKTVINSLPAFKKLADYYKNRGKL